MKDKIKSRKELTNIAKELRSKGKRIVFTNGCFDLLHIGHVRYLEEARSMGDLLIVGVNSDRSVRMLKGPMRPVLPENERAEILSGLECINYVTLFDELDPLELITSLQPHILVKGGDWSKEEIVGKDVVERAGGKVVTISFVQGASTTHLIETIMERYAKRS